MLNAFITLGSLTCLGSVTQLIVGANWCLDYMRIVTHEFYSFHLVRYGNAYSFNLPRTS